MGADADRSWDYAKRYADILGTMPERLQRALKDLRKGQPDLGESRDAVVPFTALNTLKIIYRSTKFKIPIYFAASELYPDRFALLEDDTEKALINTLGVKLFASLLALVWYRRRLSKITQVEDRDRLIQDMLTAMEVGFLLGKAMPDFGPGDTVLLAAIRYAAVGTLLVGDAETYSRYRNLHKGHLSYEFERERWGCDHAQISCYLLNFLGVMSHSVGEGTRRTPIEIREAFLMNDSKVVNNDPVLRIVRGITEIVTATMEKGEVLPLLHDIGVPDEMAERYTVSASRVVNDGSSFKWMLRGGDDE